MTTRQLLKLKHLTKEERTELKDELKYYRDQRKYSTDACPICGKELYRNSWSEDHWGVVETIERCGWSYFGSTHYSDHSSYGETVLIAGTKRFTYRHNTPWSEIDSIRAEWILAYSRINSDNKKIRRISYRKKKSQQRRLRR